MEERMADMPTNEHGERRFIGDITAFNWHGSLDDAVAEWQKVIDCAVEHGFELLGASVSNAREREPSETFNWGSTAPYRNTTAETSLGAMAGDMSTGRAGAETGATKS